MAPAESNDPPTDEAGPGALVVVGDLHLSVGAGAPLFDVDAQFARFLEYVSERLGSRRGTLLMLGDTFDFVHATADGARARAWRDTSAQASLEKLELVVRAHRVSLRALAEVAAAVIRVAVVAGNHDLELTRGSAQRRLAEVLEGYARGAAAALDFHPWIFRLPGVVYAEHGSQHHDLNALAALLTHAQSRLERPLGAELDLQRLDARAASPFVAYARLGAALLTRWASVLDVRRPRQRAHYRSSVLPEYANRLGLRRETVESLDSLAALGPLAVERRALLEFGRRAGRAVGRQPQTRGCYMQLAARAIDDVLAREGAAVPFYVFGHTHVPADRGLRRGSPAPRYLNAGTWSTILPPALRPRGELGRFGFIELDCHNGSAPSARLLRWDDERGRPEPVELR
jgi:UDP-2,3-diacylglucosamine pyrophosphatase LpxH